MRLLKGLLLVIFLLNVFTTSTQAKTMEEIAVSEQLLLIFAEIERDGPNERSVNKLKRFIIRNKKYSIVDEAYVKIGDIYLDRKEFKKASKYFKYVLEKFPYSKVKYDAIYGLAYCQYRKGDIKDSKVALNTLIANDDASHTVRAKAKLLLETVNSVT